MLLRTRRPSKSTERPSKSKERPSKSTKRPSKSTKRPSKLRTDSKILREKLKEADHAVELIRKQIQRSISGPYKIRTAPQGQPLDIDNLKLSAESCSRALSNAIASVSASFLAERRDYLKSINHVYSHLIPVEPTVTCQGLSGRCWIYAALNAMRIGLMRRLNISVKPAFELSEAYLFFYDKLERANHFLQRVQDMRDKPDTDIDVITMFTSRPTDDGGTFGYFRNLTEKYGIVPKSCYGEGFNTRYTAEMNDLLWQKLAEFAWTIRNREEADIEAMLAVIYNMLVKFMGEPPTTFTWKYYESSTDHKSHGLSHMIKDLTPQSFYADYIQPDYDVSRMVLLRHDPRERHPYFQTYACRDVTNMVNAPASIYFNVPIEVMRKATANSILHGTPVWFACDVQKDYNQEHSLLSTEAYDYGELMGTRFDMTKAQMLETYSSYPTHAMLLVGLDKDDKDDTINRWRVENSWGEVGTGEGEERGYLQMSDGWFAKYVYECVVDISYLPDDVADIYRDREYEPTWIDIRDPLALSSIKK